MERLERLELSAGTLRLIGSARVARLATADTRGQPHVIPICFAFDGRDFFSPIDEKPKRVAAGKLKRLNNIRNNSQVSLVIDHYDENWSHLAYVLIMGEAKVMQRGVKHRKAVALLRKKYSQYRRMAIHERPMIVIRPRRLITWGRL
ncbi:MAG TPA: TIGR03668 family PPOX class F420-dependent oxidoreductase [Candidatus Binatia bacterium]